MGIWTPQQAAKLDLPLIIGDDAVVSFSFVTPDGDPLDVSNDQIEVSYGWINSGGRFVSYLEPTSDSTVVWRIDRDQSAAFPKGPIADYTISRITDTAGHKTYVYGKIVGTPIGRGSGPGDQGLTLRVNDTPLTVTVTVTDLQVSAVLAAQEAAASAAASLALAQTAVANSDPATNRIYAARRGLITGVAQTDPTFYAKGLQNAALLTALTKELSDAGGGELILPVGGSGPFVASTYVGGQKGSAGWNKVAWVLDGINNVVIRGRGFRLVRHESEATGSAVNQRDASIGIYRCRNILFDDLICEGQQGADVKSLTTGNNWDIAFGSNRIKLMNCRGAKGTNALAAIGLNVMVTSEYPGKYAIDQPCYDIDIEGCEVENGEHGILVNIARNVRITRHRHRGVPYTYGGVTQFPYIQRGIFLLGCRNITIDGLELYDIAKVAIYIVTAGKIRTYSGVQDVTITNFLIQAPGNQLADSADEDTSEDITQDGNRYQGICFHGGGSADVANTYQGKRIQISDGRIIGCKTGVRMEDSESRRRQAPDWFDLIFSDIVIRTTATGFNGGNYNPIGNISVSNVDIEVFADLNYSTTAAPAVGLRLGAGLANYDMTVDANFTTDVSLVGVRVRSGSQAVALNGILGLSMTACDFAQRDDAVAIASIPNYVTDAKDFSITRCGYYGEISYRLSLGYATNSAKLRQETPRELIPRPIMRTGERYVTVAFPSVANGARVQSSGNFALTSVRSRDAIMFQPATPLAVGLRIDVYADTANPGSVTLYLTNNTGATVASSAVPGTLQYVSINTLQAAEVVL